MLLLLLLLCTILHIVVCIHQALVAARGAAPEHWAEVERKRLARRAAELDEALARERQRRLHAGRLLRALTKVDESGGGTDLLMGGKGMSRWGTAASSTTIAWHL